MSDRQPSSNWVADLHRVFPDLQRELLRVSPDLANADGVGGPTDLLPSEVLAILRALPDGAGMSHVDHAVAAYRRARPPDRDPDVYRSLELPTDP